LVIFAPPLSYEYIVSHCGGFVKGFLKKILFFSPSIKRERVYLEVHAIEVVAVGGGLVPKFTPLLGALDRLTSRLAGLNLTNVLAVSKVDNTDETYNHS
jgi:hypothetical protein